MSPSRKRRRIDPDLVAQADLNAKAVLDMVQAMLGQTANAFFLFDFLHQYAPSLTLPALSSDATDELKSLARAVVCSSESLRPAPLLRNVECKESLSNVVDDVIWSLVHRRSRIRQNKMHSRHNGRNVLCQGYVLASERLQQSNDVRPCPNMRPGILCTQMNSNVSFCKSSRMCQTLHHLVGDSMLRTILLHTTCLLPIVGNDQRSRGNYLLLCGSLSQQQSGGGAANALLRIVESAAPVDDEAPTEAGCRRLSKIQGSRRKSRKRVRKDAEVSSADQNERSAYDPNANIPRHSLFYSNAFVPSVGLPATHALNRTKNSETLLNSIFHIYVDGKKRRKRWVRLRETGIAMCDQIFERHGKCDYARLLDRYCPISAFCVQEMAKRQNSGKTGSRALNETTEKDPPQVLQQLVSLHTAPDDVLLFLVAVLRKVFPSTFWGSEHNFQRVVCVLTIFLKLRRRESLPNKALTDGIRVTDLSWLAGADHAPNAQPWKAKKRRLSRTNHLAVTTLTQHLIHWLFCKYLIPLLHSTFYITEGEFCAKRVLYYRKPVWTMFRSLSMRSLLKKQYIEIDMSDASRRLKTQSMGLSRLRLLPKKTGVRPLATLSKRELIDCPGRNDSTSVQGSISAKDDTLQHRSTGGAADLQQQNHGMKQLSTNRMLRQTFEVLRYEHERKPHSSGAGVFGLNEVYPLVQKFFQDVKGDATAKCPRLYFTSVDIHRCYDNINQERLLNISSDLLSENDYIIQKFAVIHPFDGMGTALWKVVKTAGPPDKFQSFHTAASRASRRHSKSIFVNDVSCSGVKKETVLDLLQEHLLRHMVVARGRYGERFLVQNDGIPQGSILSSMLCNLYYGDVEKELLSGVFESSTDDHVNVERQGGNLLMRVVDDFLLISTCRNTSRCFLQTMTVGNEQLGIKINEAKTLVNYDVYRDESTQERNGVKVVGTFNVDPFFPWCGMLFDTVTGEVRVDYSRFIGEQTGDALTVDRDGKEGEKLRVRMRSFARPRSQPIFFDSRINSSEVAVINFYQAMLFCAVKSVRYVCEAMAGRVGTNASFIARCIDNVIGYSWTLIVKRLDQEGGAACLGISRPVALWLGRDAFLYVLGRAETECHVVADKLRSLHKSHPSCYRRWGRARQMALNQFDVGRFLPNISS